MTYADDIILLMEEKDELRSMLERLKKYLKRKGLELNVEKMKVIRCRRGGGRRWKEGYGNRREIY